MTALLCAIFFLSGAAALLFESLWFRQAGLAFGNGVVASSVVLGSFMAGLAIGNGIAARARRRFLRPVTAYAVLELVIAATGVALVLGLPELGRLLAPLARPLVDAPLLHNLLRLVLAFALLLVPATAMGLTLPLLVQALEQRSAGFGAALGRLYGWNTLGAVGGVLIGELLLVEHLGVRGTAFAAAGFNVLAAAGAAAFARSVAHENEPPAASADEAPARIGRAAWLCLAATFLAGGTLLALEVVWFRLLHLFVHGGDYMFAVLLATVLAGIALGGLAGGAWLRRDPGAHRHAAALAWAAGFAVVAFYRAFPEVAAPFGVRYLTKPRDALVLAAFLTLPVAFLSGVLFPMLGARLREELAPARRAAGLLALYNTGGSALGSIAGGFVLLPYLGMERSLFVLALVYGVAGTLVAAAGAHAPQRRRGYRPFVAPALYVAALALFPFGQIQGFLELVVERNVKGQELVAVREGQLETIQYTRQDYLGEPLHYRLLTDGYSMAGTAPGGRRYMKLYTWWPVAFAPPPKRALLISFGSGSTAKSLTDTPSLEHIDVVDISREILELSDLVYTDPAQHPLRDPRVQVHVEDGRNFLLNSEARWDLITGEPPPPKIAGVVTLYTREYFELVREHLAPGGIHTYWLPVHALTEADARSIIAAYCAAFPDCSLWGGTHLDWMLIGTNGARWTRDERAIAAQWSDPRIATELRAVGLERPEQLAALFMEDAAQLRERIAGAAPVTDDFPKRISDFPSPDPHRERERFAAWMDAAASRERFAASAFARELLPDGLRERSLPYFEVQALMNRLTGPKAAPTALRAQVETIDWLLTETDLTTPVLWLLGITADNFRIIDAKIASGEPEEPFLAQLAVRDLAERRYASAAERFRRVVEQRPDDPFTRGYFVYALARSGRAEEARFEVARYRPQPGAEQPFWAWIARSVEGSEPRFR
jgi:predicted membrane-bound spermidine synthase